MSLLNEYVTLLHYLKQNLICKVPVKIKETEKNDVPLKVKEKSIVCESTSINTNNLKEKVNKLSKVLAENFDDSVWKI